MALWWTMEIVARQIKCTNQRLHLSELSQVDAVVTLAKAAVAQCEVSEQMPGINKDVNFFCV